MRREILKHRRMVLDDTVEYYTKYPRCVVPVSKTYNRYREVVYSQNRPYYSGAVAGVNSVGCAIGRFLPKTVAAKIDIEYGEVGIEVIWRWLPDHIQELGIEFLIELACLHDNDKWWHQGKLSQEGEEFYQELIDKFC